MESEKMDEIILPGFRFHPTDEELVGFYLKRKVQQRPLSVELIKQLDIYKYDPWDLPKLASSTGEKEWYFYCRRDRKYRNSTRPNRVTGAGFWKATGTDRPICSSHPQGSKCIIGLKKSLVFYRGRASKGNKTDWMMHEFRLPSLTTDSVLQKRFMDRNLPPASDSWVICRIFKKPNSAAQKALSQSRFPPLAEEPTPEQLVFTQVPHSTQLINTSEGYFSLTAKSSGSARTQFISCCKNELQHHHHHHQHLQQQSCIKTPPGPPHQISSSTPDLSANYPFFEPSSGPSKCTVDASSSSIFGDFFDKPSDQSMGLISSGLEEQYCNSYGFTMNATALPADHQEMLMQAIRGEERVLLIKEKDPIAPHSDLDDQCGTRVSDDVDDDSWKSNFLWDFSPCPTGLMSASYPLLTSAILYP